MASVKSRGVGDVAVDIALPTRGRIVDYTGPEGNVMPAIVSAIDEGVRGPAAPHPEPVAGSPPDATTLPADKPARGDRPAREERETPDRRGLHLQGFDAVLGCGHYYIEDAVAQARKKPGDPHTWNWPLKAGEGDGEVEPPAVGGGPTR